MIAQSELPGPTRKRARWAPRRDSSTAWISSTMTTLAVLSISRERSAVRSRYSDSGVVTRMWGGVRSIAARSACGVSPLLTAAVIPTGGEPISSAMRRISRRGDQRVLPRADRAPAFELRLGGRQDPPVAGLAEMRFPPALEDGMKVFGEHDGRAQYTPSPLRRGRRPSGHAAVFRAPLLEAIERALHAAPAFVHHMRVDHRRGYVGMPEQLLHRADVVAGFEQVRGEGVAQRMRAHRLGDPRATTRLLE